MISSAIMGISLSMNATICRRLALNWSRAAARLATSSVCQQRLREKMDITRSSLCNVVPFARDTSFQLQTTLGTPAPSIQDVLKELVDDEARNDLIFDDVLCALEAGRSPVVITERTAHLETIAKRLERFARHVVV